MEAEYFADAGTARAMDAEHRPLWAAFMRALGDVVTPGLRVMDFGCSQGGLLDVLMGGYEDLWKGVRVSAAVGVEVNTPAMRALLRAAASPGRGTLFTTASPVHFPGQFDLIVSHEVANLLPDLPRAFGELHGALTDGGYCCVTTGCALENTRYDRWRRVLARSGVYAEAYGEADYENALRCSGFPEIRRARLLLTRGEYQRWVATRLSRAPNPDWFSSPEDEENYYTEFGKMILIARKAIRPAP
jgi:SAM-dependent methyltransferase